MLKTISDGIGKFREDYPDPGSVAFLMMRFSDKQPFLQIVHAVKAAFHAEGVELLRADDFIYSPDLFTNIQIYMHGCGIGVAIFDRILSEEFNPNVSLEIGYMMGLGKPICILKDSSLKALPSDVVSRLYVDLDIHNPEIGLSNKVRNWLRTNEVEPCCHRLSIHLKLENPYWEFSATDRLAKGIPLFAKRGGKPLFKGIRKEMDYWAMDFDASLTFVNEIKKAFLNNYMKDLCGVTVVDVVQADSLKQNFDYAYQNINSDNLEIQMCFLSRFDGLEKECNEATRALPGITSDIKMCCVYITKTKHSLYYFHSNFLVPGYVYPTKILAKKFLGLRNITPFIVGDKSGDINLSDTLLLHHIRDIRYIFNKNIAIADDLPPIETNGANRIEFFDSNS